MARKWFFGLEHLKSALEKLGRVWNQRSFLSLLETKLISKGAMVAAALLHERDAISSAVSEALGEYPEG